MGTACYIVNGEPCLSDTHPSLLYFISFIPFVPSGTFFLPSLKRCKKLCYYFQVKINFGHGDDAYVITWKLRGNGAKPYNIYTKSRISHLLMSSIGLQNVATAAVLHKLLFNKAKTDTRNGISTTEYKSNTCCNWL